MFPRARYVTLKGTEAIAWLRSADYSRLCNLAWSNNGMPGAFGQGRLLAKWFEAAGRTNDAIVIYGYAEAEVDWAVTFAERKRGRAITWESPGLEIFEYLPIVHALSNDIGEVLHQIFLSARMSHVDRVSAAWLPPGTIPPARTPRGTVMRKWRRPYISIGSVDSDWSRKSSNRSKLNRLKNQGTLKYVCYVGEKVQRSHIAQVIEWRDKRFGSDGRCFDRGSLVDQIAALGSLPSGPTLSALFCDDDLIAGSITFSDGTVRTLSLIAHSSRFHAESPGKLLLHMMIDSAREDGELILDLTPGDDLYKWRYSTHEDVVFGLEMPISQSAQLRAATVRAVRSVVRMFRAITKRSRQAQ